MFLPGKFHGQRSQAGYSPWDHKESDTTEWLRMHTCKYLQDAGVVVLKKPEGSWKITVYYCKLNWIVEPTSSTVLKVVSVLGTLVRGMRLLIWQMHSFQYSSNRRTEAVCIHVGWIVVDIRALAPEIREFSVSLSIDCLKYLVYKGFPYNIH